MYKHYKYANKIGLEKQQHNNHKLTCLRVQNSGMKKIIFILLKLMQEKKTYLFYWQTWLFNYILVTDMQVQGKQSCAWKSCVSVQPPKGFI